MDRTIEELSKAVKLASGVLYACPTAQKNRVLRAVTVRLRESVPAVLAANAEDVTGAREAGLSAVLLDRLTLNEKRITQMIRGVRGVK